MARMTVCWPLICSRLATHGLQVSMLAPRIAHLEARHERRLRAASVQPAALQRGLELRDGELGWGDCSAGVPFMVGRTVADEELRCDAQV